MAGPLKDPHQANIFELSGRSTYVTYSSPAILGGPFLNYRDDRLSRGFSGEEIRFQDNELGQMVTVTLEHIPDLQIVTFTLVLPILGVPQPNTPIGIKVPGIIVTNPQTIAGPGPGPQKLYTLINLRGTGQFIVS